MKNKILIVFLPILVIVGIILMISLSLSSEGNGELTMKNISISTIDNSQYNITNSNYQTYSKQAITNNFKVYFKNNTNLDSAVRFEKDGYFFTYDLSGGQMMWKATDNQPSASSTLGSGYSSNTKDTQILISGNQANYLKAYSFTNLSYSVTGSMLKENFILSNLTSGIKDYLYLEYSGNIKFNKTLNICTNGICYTPKGTQDDFETQGQIDFRNSTNDTIFFLQAPVAIDSIGNKVNLTYIVHGSNAQMKFYLRIPTSFLQTAKYPIFLDPTVSIPPVVSQSEKKLTYTTTWNVITDLTLYKLVNGLYSNNASDVQNLFVFYNNDSYKFGANDSANTGIENYKYTLTSSDNLILKEMNVYYVESHLENVTKNMINTTTQIVFYNETKYRIENQTVFYNEVRYKTQNQTIFYNQTKYNVTANITFYNQTRYYPNKTDYNLILNYTTYIITPYNITLNRTIFKIVPYNITLNKTEQVSVSYIEIANRTEMIDIPYVITTMENITEEVLNYTYPVFYNYYNGGNWQGQNDEYDFQDICSKSYANCSWNLSEDKKSGYVIFNSDSLIDPLIDPVSTCGTIDTAGVYTLNQSINSTGTCITITADNVALDCNNFWINGSSTGLNQPTITSAKTNTTIKNCKITNLGSSYGNYLMSLTGGSYTIYNNYLESLNGGITSGGPSNINITNNIFNLTGTSASGIYFSSASICYNNSVINNTFYKGSKTMWSRCGQFNAVFTDNYLASNAGYLLFYKKPISTENTIIGRNIIQTPVVSNIIDFSGNNTNLTFIDYQIGTISMEGTSNNITFKNVYGDISFSDIPVHNYANLFSNSSTIGYVRIGDNYAYVTPSSVYDKPANVTFYNLPTDLTNPFIIRDGSNFCNATTTPACFNWTSLNAGNVTFQVGDWSNYTIYDEIYGPAFSNPIEYNQGGVSEGRVRRGENFTINVTVTDFSGISNVWVKIWEGIVGSAIKWTGFLDNLGDNLWGVIVPTNSTWDYGEINYTIFSNDTFGYESNLSSTVNILEDKLIYECTNITSSGTYTLANDVESVGVCFNISAENVILDGNGFNINSTEGSPIVFSSASFNSTVKNAIIEAGSSTVCNDAVYDCSGIAFSSTSTNDTINNNTIISYGHGVNFKNNELNGTMFSGNTITPNSYSSSGGYCQINNAGSCYTPPFDTCQTIDTSGVYTVTAPLSSEGTCLTISADDVVLDGNGSTITYNQVDGDNQYGILITGARNNITIKNFNDGIGNGINDGQSGSSYYNYAIFTDSDLSNSLISNNYINAYYASGIVISGYSSYNYIDDDFGINNIYAGNSGCNDYNYYCSGIVYGYDSYSDTVDYNSITAGNYGIFYIYSSYQNILTYNTITSSYDGIDYSTTSESDRVENNIISSSGGKGIFYNSDTQYNQVNYNQIDAQNNYGIYSASNSNDDDFTYNTIISYYNGMFFYNIPIGESVISNNDIDSYYGGGIMIYYDYSYGNILTLNSNTIDSEIYSSCNTGDCSGINIGYYGTYGYNNAFYMDGNTINSYSYPAVNINTYSSGSVINANSFYSQSNAFQFYYDSSYDTLTGNTFTSNYYSGLVYASSSSNNIINNNNYIYSGVSSCYDASYSCAGIAYASTSTNDLINGNYIYGSINNYATSSYNTISGNTIDNSGSSSYDAILFSVDSSYNTISGNTIATNYEGIDYTCPSTNDIITGNGITSSGASIYLSDVTGIIISGNTLTSTGASESNLNFASTSSGATISGNTIDSQYMSGIEFFGASSNNIINGSNTINAGTLGCSDGTYACSGIVYASTSTNDLIDTNIISASQVGAVDLLLSTTTDNLTLQDQKITNYNIAGTSNISFINTTYGQISLFNIDAILAGTGTDLIGNGEGVSDVAISNNSAYVNSAKGGLNKSASVTLYNLVTLSHPIILRDGLLCPSSICSGLTNVGNNYSFDVTGWSNYSIYDDTSLSTINLTNPQNNSYHNTNQNFTANLSDDYGLGNTTLYIYNSSNSLINSTIFTSISGALNSIVGVVVNLLDGVYHWFYQVFDFAGNSNVSSNYTFNKDTIIPTININSPLNTIYNIDTIPFNLTLDGLSYCNYTSNDGLNNFTLSTSDNINFYSLVVFTYIPPLTQKNITFYCSDFAGNKQSSAVTFYISSPTTGGGGGSPNYPNNIILSNYLCNKTYYYILNGEYGIWKLKEEIKDETYFYEDESKLRYYVDNWQQLCSNAINKTLEPRFVCNKIYYYLLGSNDFNSTKSQIMSKINISNYLIDYYINNYNTECFLKGYSQRVYNPNSVLNLNLESTGENCSLDTGSFIFDNLYLPIGQIGFGNATCNEIDNWKWFFKLSEINKNVQIIGIQLWIIILILVLILIIMIVKVNNKLNRIRKKN